MNNFFWGGRHASINQRHQLHPYTIRFRNENYSDGNYQFRRAGVLRQCVVNPSITSIDTLVRRDLAAELANENKIKVIKITDFGNYPDELIEELSAEACIW